MATKKDGIELQEQHTGKEPEKHSSPKEEETGKSSTSSTTTNPKKRIYRHETMQELQLKAPHPADQLIIQRLPSLRTFDKKIPFVDPNKDKKFKEFWSKKDEKLKSHYVNYTTLKQQLKRLTRKDWSQVTPSTFWQSDSGLFDERVGASILKLSAPEIEFFATFEREKIRVNKYIMSKVQELEESIGDLFVRTRTAVESTLDPLIKEADVLCEETRLLHFFIYQNKVAYHKLMEVYEKKTVSRGSWILVQLEKENFWNITVDHLIATLSDIYKKIAAIRSRTNTNLNLVAATVATFERKTFKFWIRPEHVVAVKLIVLKNLPVQIFEKRPRLEDGFIPRDFSDSSLISSIYFDNDRYDMYYGRLIEGKGRGNLIRIRWYGSNLNPTPEVYVECKTRKKVPPTKTETAIEGVPPKEKFEAIKERFRVKRGHVLDYISGKNTVAKKIEKLVTEGAMQQPDATATIDIASEIQQEIVQKQLKPYLRTVYRRTAFQQGTNQAVRISLDTNLHMILEGNQLKEGWYRDYDDTISVPDVILFPYAVLEIKLQEEPPSWINQLIASGYLIPGFKFSKFTHGMAEFFGEEVTQFPRWWYVLHPDSNDTNTSLEPTKDISLDGNEDADSKDTSMKRSVTFDPKLRSQSVDNTSRTSSTGSVENKNEPKTVLGYITQRRDTADRKASDANPPRRISDASPRKISDAPRKDSDASRKDSDAQRRESDARRDGTPRKMTDTSTNGEENPNTDVPKKSIFEILREPVSPLDDEETKKRKKKQRKKLLKLMEQLSEGGKYKITDEDIQKTAEEDDPEDKEKSKWKAKKGTEKDPKVYFANERTLLSWLNMVTFLAIAAISLLSFGQSLTQIAGLTLVPLSIIFSIYALIRYHVRAQGIRQGIMKGIDDKVGPYVFTVLLCATLIIVTAFSFTYGAIPANSVTLRIERGASRAA